jgi:hypothetical protein
LTADEQNWIRAYIRHNLPTLRNTALPTSCLVFKRALFRTEIHSRQYTAVRTRCSTNVAIMYDKIFYGTVLKFFLIKVGRTTLRLALVLSYPFVASTELGVLRVNLTAPYATGRIVQLIEIDHKVMFAGPLNRTSVLRVPHSYTQS